MDETVTVIWAAAFIVILIGFIPYGIWFFISLIKKRWERAAWLFALPLLLFMIFHAISIPLEKIAYSKYLREIYDVEIDLKSAIYNYDSPRSFQGDGYSISVYELPIEIRQRFESADTRLLEQFPKRPNYRSKWSIEQWSEAPLDPKFNKHLDFSLSSYDAKHVSELSSYFHDIRSALKQKNTYYAFFFKGHKDFPGNIDMFIIDLDNNRLYDINHNT
ncbi:MAG: hypothetical protein V3W04_00235 [Gammaproteobacteria bacterium]